MNHLDKEQGEEMIETTAQESTTAEATDLSQETEQGYKVSITGRHLMVTEAMKQYAMEKISKLERITQRILEIHIIMDIQKLEHRVDVIVRFNHIKIKVQAHSHDMYSSVDRAVEKLQAQVRRYKDKLQQHQAKSISIIDMNVNVINRDRSNFLQEVNDQIEERNAIEVEHKLEPHKIVKREVRPLKTLTQDEAVMKMELSTDSFMVYRAEEDRKLKVIYKREDENFGVIEPE